MRCVRSLRWLVAASRAGTSTASRFPAGPSPWRTSTCRLAASSTGMRSRRPLCPVQHRRTASPSAPLLRRPPPARRPPLAVRRRVSSIFRTMSASPISIWPGRRATARWSTSKRYTALGMATDQGKTSNVVALSAACRKAECGRARCRSHPHFARRSRPLPWAFWRAPAHGTRGLTCAGSPCTISTRREIPCGSHWAYWFRPRAYPSGGESLC